MTSVLREASDLRQDRRLDLLVAGRRRPRGHRDRAGIVLQVEAAADAGHEPELLPERLDQPRRPPLPEDGRHQVEGVDVGVRRGDARPCEPEIRLVEGLRFLQPARRARRLRCPAGPRRERLRHPAPERRAHGFEAPRRRHATGHHHRHVVRHVGAPVVVDDGLARHLGNGLRGPEHGPAVGMLAEVPAGQHAPQGRARRILGAADLLEDDVPLAVDLDRIERGVLGGVGQHVQRRVEPLGRQHDVEVRPVLRGRRVHLAPEPGDRLVDHAGSPRRRPLEEEVLDEVRQARLVRALVAGPRPHPELHGGDVRRVVRMEHDGEAVRQPDAFRARIDRIRLIGRPSAGGGPGRHRRSTLRSSRRPARKWRCRWSTTWPPSGPQWMASR